MALKLPYTYEDLVPLFDEARKAVDTNKGACFPLLLSCADLPRGAHPATWAKSWMDSNNHRPVLIQVFALGWLMRSAEKTCMSEWPKEGKNPAFDDIVASLGLDPKLARRSLKFYHICKMFPGLLLAPSVEIYLWGLAPLNRLADLITKNDVISDYLKSPAVRRLVFPDGGGRSTPGTFGAGASSFGFPRSAPAPTPMLPGAPPPGERPPKRLRLDRPEPRINTPPVDRNQPASGSLADLRLRALKPVRE